MHVHPACLCICISLCPFLTVTGYNSVKLLSFPKNITPTVLQSNLTRKQIIHNSTEIIYMGLYLPSNGLLMFQQQNIFTHPIISKSSLKYLTNYRIGINQLRTSIIWTWQWLHLQKKHFWPGRIAQWENKIYRTKLWEGFRYGSIQLIIVSSQWQWWPTSIAE